MHGKLYYKAIIEDIQNDKCSESEMLDLTSVFARTIKRMATTLARKSYYDLKDFHGSKYTGIDGFNLTVERKEIIGGEHFVGQFLNGNKNLKLIASLEK